ncbi:Protein PYP1 [Gracilariopsis chorda]|uniref:Protein PYP1 n=1 Tax=Gracilariopsis chorda TaxID=448386 RepID=A0A2V3J0E1_9FLOR|nr:Protein PYP1 [Gracilariopsis chorda]|eukprot:PXF46830.1 Protein PYP1 [Gracilariopsis chorda]
MAFITSFSGISVRGSVSSSSVCTVAPRRAAKWTMDGKGFGGGEATRDPEPTKIDPNDPKGKQKAIHPAETFAEYQARVAREKAEKEK